MIDPVAGRAARRGKKTRGPQTSEQTFRETLNASHARLVDGPTAADAYVLRVSPGERDAALATLRRRPDITLAQPIDAGDTH